MLSGVRTADTTRFKQTRYEFLSAKETRPIDPPYDVGGPGSTSTHCTRERRWLGPNIRSGCHVTRGWLGTSCLLPDTGAGRLVGSQSSPVGIRLCRPRNRRVTGSARQPMRALSPPLRRPTRWRTPHPRPRHLRQPQRPPRRPLRPLTRPRGFQLYRQRRQPIPLPTRRSGLCSCNRCPCNRCPYSRCRSSTSPGNRSR